ncbi:hypothetical protein RUND412_008034 [Rhizina undulata]
MARNKNHRRRQRQASLSPGEASKATEPSAEAQPASPLNNNQEPLQETQVTLYTLESTGVTTAPAKIFYVNKTTEDSIISTAQRAIGTLEMHQRELSEDDCFLKIVKSLKRLIYADAWTMTDNVDTPTHKEDETVKTKNLDENSDLKPAQHKYINRRVTRAEVEASNKEAREFVRREMAKILEQHEKQSVINQAEHAKWRHDFAQRQRMWRWANGASTYPPNEALAKIAESSTAKESHQESLAMKARLEEEKKRLEAQLLVLQQREKMEIQEMRDRKEQDQRKLEAMLEKTQELQALLASGSKYNSILGLGEGSSFPVEVAFGVDKSLKVTESQIKNALDDVASYLRTVIQSGHEESTEVE